MIYFSDLAESVFILIKPVKKISLKNLISGITYKLLNIPANLFSEEFSSLMYFLLTMSKLLYLRVNFTNNLRTYPTGKAAFKFLCTLLNQGFHLMVSLPTEVTDRSAILVDIIIT